MARFVFRLEVLLKQRKRAEQEAQRELAVRTATLVEAQNALRELDQQVRAATEDLRLNHLTGSIDLNYLSAHRRFLNAMQRRALTQAQKIGAAQVRVDEARGLLSEAAKARKAIEKLKEKQLERWKAERDRKEMASLDEIGMQIGYANQADSSDNTESTGVSESSVTLL